MTELRLPTMRCACAGPDHEPSRTLVRVLMLAGRIALGASKVCRVAVTAVCADCRCQIRVD